MITCKIGNSIINCYDDKYNKSQLKEWSDKNILKCPVCGGTYEYCHGMIISQYYGQHQYDGFDFTNIEYFIKEKIDELQREELSE